MEIILEIITFGVLPFSALILFIIGNTISGEENTWRGFRYQLLAYFLIACMVPVMYLSELLQ